MIYSDFQGEKISRLAFGAMRLPTKEDKSIDEETTRKMIDLAIKNGVNYFDTAYPYHGGMSERVIGKILSQYPRDSFYLATKFPGHQIADRYDPKAIFEEQLEKCRVDYFDFYLLHNVCEVSMPVYTDKKWGIIDYFKEQKRLGRIGHLGFSCHGRPDNLEEFLSLYGQDMEFCQIQLNYLDYTLQEGKKKCEILAKYNIPIWVMEPVRGGKLANLGEKERAVLAKIRPNESPASWAFRWLFDVPGVKVILSGMSSIEQMEDNIRTFSDGTPLCAAEKEILATLAEKMKNSLPCTACRYCCDGCPAGLDIPTLIGAYNDVRYSVEGGLTASMQLDAMPKEKWPTACIGCGACKAVCPQKIDIPQAMADFSATLSKLPNWTAICRQRAIDNEKNKKL